MSHTVSSLVAYFFFAIVLDHAHLVSPILRVWSSPNMRHKMLKQWQWYVLMPLGFLAIAVVIGLLSSSPTAPGFVALAVVYNGWNAWHYGSQHYGLATLAGWRSGPRRRRQLLTIGPTIVVLALPFFFSAFVFVIINVVIDLLHWLTDIGLSTWKARRWGLFLCVVAVLGLGGFLFKTVSVGPQYCGQLAVCTAIYGFVILRSTRYGLGIVHFLCSRWAWTAENMRLMEQSA